MENRGEIVIYQTQDGLAKLDVLLDGETVWITQDQMAELFDRDRTAINRHINNISPKVSWRKMWSVQILHTPLRTGL